MAHRYFDTVHACVWGAVDNDLEPLLHAVQRMRDRLERDDHVANRRADWMPDFCGTYAGSEAAEDHARCL